jgi:hypothetical protein
MLFVTTSQLWRNRGQHATTYYFPDYVEKKTIKTAKVTAAGDASDGDVNPTTPCKGSS